MLAITTIGTAKYAYALFAQARRVCAAITEARSVSAAGGIVILVSDGCPKAKAAEATYKELLADQPWKVHHIQKPNLEDGIDHANGHGKQGSLLVAQMHAAAIAKALQAGANHVWQLEGDVLPPSNALRCLFDALRFDDGFYDIAISPYPNQALIGGRGRPDAVIHNDQREGNIFQRQAQGWQPQGWLMDAYPALGRGAIVPIDWAGFGCNLMTRRAAAALDFSGYSGDGTADLWICYQRFLQHGLRMCAVPHVLSGHAKENPGKPGEYILYRPYHETKGDMEGHIRIDVRPFYEFVLGEKFVPGNKGIVCPRVERKKDIPAIIDTGFAIGMLQVRKEVEKLAAWMEVTMPRIVVEIGTNGGGLLYVVSSLAVGSQTTEHLPETCKKFHSPRRIASIDLHGGPFGSQVDYAYRNKTLGDMFGVKWIEGKSLEKVDELRAWLGDDRIDFLIIDGDHAAAGKDFEAYKPLMRPGGHVMFHDIADSPEHRAAGCTVADDWKAIEGEKTEWIEDGKWAGIGIVKI